MPGQTDPATGDSVEAHVHLLTVSRPELLRDGSDQAFRAMVHDVLGFAARIQQVRNRFGGLLSLSGSQYTVLVALSQLQGQDGVGVNTLAEHLHLSGAFVTIEVNKLVAGGFVRKEVNTSDRRRVRLTITPYARKQLNAITPVLRPANDILFGELTSDDFERFRRILPALVTSADQALRTLDYLAPDGKLAAADDEPLATTRPAGANPKI